MIAPEPSEVLIGLLVVAIAAGLFGLSLGWLFWG